MTELGRMSLLKCVPLAVLLRKHRRQAAVEAHADQLARDQPKAFCYGWSWSPRSQEPQQNCNSREGNRSWEAHDSSVYEKDQESVSRSQLTMKELK